MKLHLNLSRAIILPFQKCFVCYVPVCLFLATSLVGHSQAKPAPASLTIALNDSFALINGSAFSANKMLADNLFKTLGTPDQIDTLSQKQLKTIADYQMATLNKYTSKGLMLEQGKKTQRVNDIDIYLNPDLSKRFIDYVNAPFKGKLTIMGVKIDSNTTVKQLQTAFAKYDFFLSEEYKSASATVYDKKTTARLLELHFHLTSSLQKIEYISFQYYPSQPLKRMKMEYKDHQLNLNGVLIDSASNKTTALKKIFGAPNAVIDGEYKVGRKTRKFSNYLYNDIRGISFFEDPLNNSILSLKLNFLTLRKEHDLDNPFIGLTINGKPFVAEKAVPNGPEDTKKFYALDSVIVNMDEKENAKATAVDENGCLVFDFAGKYKFESRVYYVTYEPVRPDYIVDASSVSAVPGFFINDSKVWVQLKNEKVYWENGNGVSEKLYKVLGQPSKIDTGYLAFADYGAEILKTSAGKLREIQFFLTPIKNAYSDKEESPGVFTGHIEFDGVKLTTETTIDDLNKNLPMYRFQKAYNDKSGAVYNSRYNGVLLYIKFHASSGKLAYVSVDAAP